MKLNEFVGFDAPSDKIIVGHDTIKDMLATQDDVDSSAFLLVYKILLEGLAPIAAERACTRDWEDHPMWGINCADCKDHWAQSYQKNYILAEQVLALLMKRIDQV